MAPRALLRGLALTALALSKTPSPASALDPAEFCDAEPMGFPLDEGDAQLHQLAEQVVHTHPTLESWTPNMI